MLTDYRSKPFTKDAEIVSFDKVDHHDIEWLWPNYIPLGTLTLIAGDPGVGKSFLTLYMAATVSAGLPWPNSSGLNPPVPLDDIDAELDYGNWKSPGEVLILNNEDFPMWIMHPRLAAMNADLSKVKLIRFVWRNDGSGDDYAAPFNIATDMFALKNAVSGYTKLIIIDPLMSFFGGKDTYRDSHVRASLTPLINLAAKYHVAVVCVVHLNKGSSNKIFNRIMGSLAFSSSARTVWFVHSLPNAENKKKSLLSPAKNNLIENPQTLSFEMKNNRIIFDDKPFTQDALSPGRAGLPVLSEVEGTPPFSRAANGGEIFPQATNIESPRLNRAVDWLKKLLADGNPLPSKKIFALAKEQGFSNWILHKVRKSLHIKCFPEKNENGQTYWSWKLPNLIKICA